MVLNHNDLSAFVTVAGARHYECPSCPTQVFPLQLVFMNVTTRDGRQLAPAVP